MSRYVDQPSSLPVRMLDGWWVLDCQGGGQYLDFQATQE